MLKDAEIVLNVLPVSAMKKRRKHCSSFSLRTGRDLNCSLHLNIASVCIHLITLQINEYQQNTHSQLSEHKVYELAE